MKQTVKQGDIVDLDILDAGDGNQSFARLENGMGVFIRGVHVPGDRVRARVTKVKKRHAELSFLERLVSSPDRIEAPCRLFGRCGGCRWQELRYEKQLELKQKTVQDTLQRVGGFRDFMVEETRAAPDVYGYRNKVDLVFSSDRADQDPETAWSLGFHVQGADNAVLSVEACHLIPADMNDIAERVRYHAQAQGWQAYDEAGESGLLRSLMIRKSHYTGQVMVNLVTSGPVPNPDALVDVLTCAKTVSVHTIVNSIATQQNRVIVDRSIILSGSGVIEEQFCGLTYTVSPASFLQTNTCMAEALYAEVLARAAVGPKDRVLDLYCGIGTISLLLAQQASRVFGTESVRKAVDDARDNAVRNDISNVEFRRDILGRDGEPKFPPNIDVIVTDPPRDGMEEGVIAAMCRTGARRIVYVSCHPASLARDAKRICDGGTYQLMSAVPFDLFPQTAHIETLAVFENSARSAYNGP